MDTATSPTRRAAIRHVEARLALWVEQGQISAEDAMVAVIFRNRFLVPASTPNVAPSAGSGPDLAAEIQWAQFGLDQWRKRAQDARAVVAGRIAHALRPLIAARASSAELLAKAVALSARRLFADHELRRLVEAEVYWALRRLARGKRP